MKREPIDLRPSARWWREPMMWLVVSGPAAVVAAGLVTAAIAVRGADPVLPVTQAGAEPTAMTPAQQARNHAATARDAQQR